jgi:hypothetical protein
VGGDPISYELSLSSPCINAGDPNSPPDSDGTRADMGAFPVTLGAGCTYRVGDINNSNTVTGLDVVYGVRYFKGGPAPFITCPMCPQPAPFYAAGDVNGSCTFSGLDITYMVRYFKGGAALIFCPSCPPVGFLSPRPLALPPELRSAVNNKN